MPFVCAILSAALFALSIPFSKILLTFISPLLLASVLYLGGGAGLLILSLIGKKGKEASIEKKDIPYILGFIICGSVLAPVLLLKGLSLFNASLSSLLMNLEIFFTALIAIYLFKENSSKRLWIALCIMFASAGIISFDFELSGLRLNAGALFIILGAFFWGVDNNLTAKVSIKNPIFLSAVKCLAGGAVNLCLALFLNQEILINIKPILGAMLLGFLSYGLSLSLLVFAMRKLGALRAQFLFGLNPFIASAVSVILLKEPLNLKFALAFSSALTAVVLMLSEKHSHRHFHEKITHSHRHIHDEHHKHVHDKNNIEYEHAHEHTHAELTHEHKHFPDSHHKHKH